MIERTTYGIRVAVKTTYRESIYRNNRFYYLFSYNILIENNSNETVQLLERFWTIFDSLNDVDFVEGPGVIGQTPTLEPGDVYEYRSNCFLSSTIGAMKGYYKMTTLDSGNEFMVTVPTFQLHTSFSQS